MVTTQRSAEPQSAWSGAFQVQRRIADDPNAQAGAIAGWTQEYDQLEPGLFEGRLTELLLDDVHLFAESTNRTLRQTCRVRSGAFWFGIPDQAPNVAGDGGRYDHRTPSHDTASYPSGLGKIGARPITNDALAFKAGDVDFELVTPSEYQIFGIVVKGDALARAAADADVSEKGVPDRLLADDIASIGAERKAHLRQVMRSILTDGNIGTAPLTPFLRENLQSQILALLFDLCVARPAKAGPALSKPHRKWIVEQTRAYVLEHRDRPLSIPEICTHLRVSRRMLQYCFQEIYGMSPVAYLRAIRLNGVRRTLLGAPTDEPVSIQSVAAAWGFWHLSQFSADYRHLFGVTPSQTRQSARGLVN